MTAEPSSVLDIHNFEPPEAVFRREVLEGLRQTPKTLPCKYLYDERGSQLFDDICELPEYYPTRTELAIMHEHVQEMADALGRNCLLIEYGSGSSIKTRLLLAAMKEPAGYVPLDISLEHLTKSAEELSAEFPDIEIMPVCADYTADFDLPEPKRPAAWRAVYFPGSTIGNFLRNDAVEFLRHIAGVVGKGGELLIGVDLKKDVATMEAAYNDAAGVTAEFNFNLLDRFNRELDSDIDRANFRFRATWNPHESRIESHLISDIEQTVRIAGVPIHFERNERIRTECSYKYSLEDFAAIADEAGFEVRKVWTDENNLFSVQYLVAK